MECNKDEAMRAREMAEKKMEDKDFEGARKIAKKAQNLYPELENINQLLSICDVQCSAQKMVVGVEKDWYGILQVDRLADELTVKKQYRKLALYLHPDKNRFPGAESAFKMICEANAVLSDPTKKSLYDSKIRVTVRSVNAPPHLNRNAQFNKQYGNRTNVCNGFNSLNPHQTMQSNVSSRQDVFWTSCPFCSQKYQYSREFVNTFLRCQNCSKSFMGYESVPMGSKWVPGSAQPVHLNPTANQSVGAQQKEVMNKGKFTMGIRNDKGPLTSQAEPQRNHSRRPVRQDSGVPAVRVSRGIHTESDAKLRGDLNAKETNSCNVNTSYRRKETGTCNGDAINREAGDLKPKTKKRGRKMVVESSESFDVSSESDVEDVTTEEKFFNPTSDLNSGPSYAHNPRRSSRKRQHVSYNEGDDDDLTDFMKRPQASKLSADNKIGQKDAFRAEDAANDHKYNCSAEAVNTKSDAKEMEAVRRGGSLGDKDAKLYKEVNATGEAGRKSYTGVDTIEIESDSDRDSFSNDNLDKGIDCADPEFSNFDKDRDESCFAVGQFWACYDDVDGMPRFYAKVKKVQASPFELSITWLEAGPMDEAHMKWIDEGLPVGCGTFKLGKTKKTSLQLTFSHQVHYVKGMKRGTLIIYPQEGEVWAIFRDWDMSWSSKPENHKEFKYEIVQVLGDFDAIAGVKVCYLDKVEGFVSLFQRSCQSETDCFSIGANELFKFSHRVPHSKMTGSEREGVPVNSLELDPAALPLNPDDLYYPSKAKCGKW